MSEMIVAYVDGVYYMRTARTRIQYRRCTAKYYW